MKKLCESLKDHATKIMNFKEKVIKLLPGKQQELYKSAKICYICKKKFENKCIKVKDHCHFTGEYRGAAHSICSLKYSVPKEIFTDLYNGSNYDYHSIIKELAKKF